MFYNSFFVNSVQEKLASYDVEHGLLSSRDRAEGGSSSRGFLDRKPSDDVNSGAVLSRQPVPGPQGSVNEHWSVESVPSGMGPPQLQTRSPFGEKAVTGPMTCSSNGDCPPDASAEGSKVLKNGSEESKRSDGQEVGMGSRRSAVAGSSKVKMLDQWTAK